MATSDAEEAATAIAFAFDGAVMQTLLLSQSRYMLKMIGVLTAFLHPNVGWIFLLCMKQGGNSFSFGTPLTLKFFYKTKASNKISVSRTLATTA